PPPPRSTPVPYTTLFRSGRKILQGSDTANILTTLDGLVTAAQTGNQTAIAAGLDAINRAFSRAVQAQTSVGADESGVADVQAALDRKSTRLNSSHVAISY